MLYNLSSYMKVFFTCSTRSIEKYSKNYRAIRDAIISSGNKINRDWIDYSINVAKRNTPDVPSHTIYEDVMTAILTADAVVVDATIRNMALGHQLTYALQNEKPVLLLRLKTKKDTKEKLFVEGSKFKNLNAHEYTTPKEAKAIVKQFFEKYKNKPKKRFNLVLTGSQYNYINWAAYYYKKTKTDIIHESIEDSAEKDSLYKKYLSKQS